MKKSIFIIFFLLAVIQIQAQDYLIDFSGSGATTVVDTVKVDNLTSGASVTLNGGDLLHLTGDVGIEPRAIDNGNLQIYPNPTAGQSMVTFITPVPGNTVVSVMDFSGKTLYENSRLLPSGTNSFRISGCNHGGFLVRISGEGFTWSTKIVCQNNNYEVIKLEWVSSAKNSGNYEKTVAATTIDMPYTTGDLLLFTGISGIYTTLVTDVPVSSKTITFNFVACTDYDNNHYKIVHIGTQTWMAENLKTTHYRNGEAIPNITDNDAWGDLSTGAFCWYNNDETLYKPEYGALYNWYALNDSRNLCPLGWHCPSDDEWTVLTDSLGGLGVAGGKMKSTGTIEGGTGLWYAPNAGATNASGFSAFPGGYRYDIGTFNYIGDGGRWWSATQSSTNYAYYRYLEFDYEGISRGSLIKKYGYSLRCVKD